MRETYAYTILEKKTKKLRAETGNEKLRSAADTGVTPQELFSASIIRPTKMLLFSPIILLLSLYMAIIYGYLYLLFTAMPTLYATQYGFSTGSIGLTYIGSGIGSILGLALSGGLSDRLMKRLTAKNGGEPKPEYRLPTMVVASFFVPLGLFVYGWTAEKNLHWILPIVGMGFLSFGMMCAFVSCPLNLFLSLNFSLTSSKMGISVYIVDAYTRYAASAMSATTVLRSLVGALLPLVGGRMYNSLGYGWGTSLLAFIAVAMIPVPVVFLMYGEKIRQKTFFNVNIY
jgi:MFS family permease